MTSGGRRRTDEPGEGMWTVPSIRARTTAFLVAGSMRESSATILAVTGADVPAETSTSSPLVNLQQPAVLR